MIESEAPSGIEAVPRCTPEIENGAPFSYQRSLTKWVLVGSNDNYL